MHIVAHPINNVRALPWFTFYGLGRANRVMERNGFTPRFFGIIDALQRSLKLFTLTLGWCAISSSFTCLLFL